MRIVMIEDITAFEDDSQNSDVNVSPLIDMVFILLIFFVITTNFNRQTGVDVSKPKARSAVYQGQKTVLIGISREGSIHVFGRQVGIERLKYLIAQEVEKRPDVSIVIVSDRNAALGKAVEVMDQCALAGAKHVSIAAEKE
ncbi:MAG: biopolymer transporter ExbD [Fibrobacter sp.]|nr:biopolymer transporter ExbD [Fibrobacter sp.]